MNKRKLLLVLENFAVGGAQNMVYELAKNINQDEYSVQVLCYGKKIDNFLSANVGEIFPVDYLNFEGKITIPKIFKVFKKLNEYKPDVIHAHLGGVAFAVIWGLLKSKTVVATVHTKPEKAFSNTVQRFVKMALKRRKLMLVAVSKENYDFVKQYYSISDDAFYVNNGIDTERFFSKAHDNFTVVHVGRQDENKNQSALIRSFSKLHKENPEALLYLVGDGELNCRLKEEAEALGLANSVIFTGNVQNTEDYYAKSDLYVQCSHREAMPLSILEAMAASLPIVSTSVGGIADVVNGNGFLVPDNSDEELTNAMLKIMNMPKADLELLKNKSIEIVDDYSSKKMGERYMAIYEECIKRNGKICGEK